MDNMAVAIVSISIRLPGAAGVDQFWQNLCRGVNSITFMSNTDCADFGIDEQIRLASNFVPAEGIPKAGPPFDPSRFDISPREAELMHPQQKLFLQCASEVLSTVGESSRVGKTGVFVGYHPHGHTFSLPQFSSYRRPPASAAPESLTTFSSLANLASYKLDLTGASVDVQSGSPASLVAVHLACQQLLGGEIDLAIAGGVSHRYPWERGYLYQEGSIFSPDGYCRAFDVEARGTVPGSGLGVVALMRLEDAVASGLHVFAVILGSAMNNDGAEKVGFTAPSVSGQATVIAECLGVAGVLPSAIGYVEAHGTGTLLGDPVEIESLNKSWSGFKPLPAASCGIGSVKTNIGHLDAAAGIVGLIKATLSLERGAIPPSLNFVTPHHHLNLGNSPFRVNAQLCDWRSEKQRRLAAVSSFGIGGTNVHLVLGSFVEIASYNEETDESILESILERRKTPHVFVSYVREDSILVDNLCQGLEANGVNVWRDKNRLVPGERWKQAIEKAIRAGSFFLACFSSNYSARNSTYMNEELFVAIEELRLRSINRSWFLPVLLTECEIPDRRIGAGENLRDLHAVFLYEGWERGMRSIVAAIKGE